MFQIRYAAPAISDLTDIADYLEREASPRVAAAVVRRVRLQIRTLERDALRHRVRTELGHERRALLISPYLAFYRVESDIVFVLRVLHSARLISLNMLDGL